MALAGPSRLEDPERLGSMVAEVVGLNAPGPCGK